MSLLNLPAFSIEEASKRGQDVFEVLFDRWGVIEDPTNAVYDQVTYPSLGEPGIPLSVAGIGIGPRSTVDRAWVTYNLQKPPNNQTPGAQTDRVRRLSVDSPLYFTQAGRAGRANYAKAFGIPSAYFQQYSQGHLYVYASANTPQSPITSPNVAYTNIFPLIQDTTVLPASILQANGTAIDFSSSADATVFKAPLLHLLIYLKPPNVIPPPTRFPLQFTGEVVLEDTDELCVAQIPIFGRKHVDISTNSLAGITLRTALVRAINQKPARVWETNSQTSILTGAGTTEIEYDHPNADYLMVYLKGAGDQPAVWAVTAYDS